MSKEQQLLKHILSLPKSQLSQIQGKPSEVLKVMAAFMQDYAKTNGDMFMHIGDKGPVIMEELQKKKPQNAMELGGYVGFSAILYGQELKKNHGKYYSFELSEEYANISRTLVEIAGLQDVVELVVGPTTTTLPNFFNYQKGSQKVDARPIDFIFIDHDKDSYVSDLRILETVGAIQKGTVIAADNIIIPGAPMYHNYVNATPAQKKAYFQHIEKEKGWGNFDFEYDTKLIETRGAIYDAIDISVCTKAD